MNYQKYPLHPDFRKISFMSFPASTSLLPVCNLYLTAVKKREHSSGLIKVRRKTINGYRGSKIDLIIYEPYTLPDYAPCLIYYHGGGMMFKASAHHFRMMKSYALSAQCKVIFVDYSTVPGVKFPIPAEECYKAYVWTVKNAINLNIDPHRIAVGGDSAGGNLAAAVTLMARDRNAPSPCFQMLIYPVLDRRMQTDSMKKYYDTPVWNSGLSRIMWRLYLSSSEVKNIEYASPMEAEDFSGLPAAYIETAEFDCLHDEGVIYAEKLKEDGVSVTLHSTRGTPHGYDSVPDSRITRKCLRLRALQLKKAFERGGSDS